MLYIHNLGFPRIGAQRELKFALEDYWQGDLSAEALQSRALELRDTHWQQQRDLDWLPVGDFSLYDHVLDASALFGNLPIRACAPGVNPLSHYFRSARGRDPLANHLPDCKPAKMTKWFNTNYHYLVPEFDANTQFELHSQSLIQQVQRARQQGYLAKPVLLGPLTYLASGRSTDNTSVLAHLDSLLVQYSTLLQQLHRLGVEWVQLDEPILCTELDGEWQMAFRYAYQHLNNLPIKRLLTTYFGTLGDNRSLIASLPIQGLHIDCSHGPDDAHWAADCLPDTVTLSLGVVDGRNVWRCDVNALLQWLQPLYQQQNRDIWLAPSCSLLHVPHDLTLAQDLPDEVRQQLAFAVQKLDELVHIKQCLLAPDATQAATTSTTATHPTPRWDDALLQRSKPVNQRRALQQARLNLPVLPTTTIGSFPQTPEIRALRHQFRQGAIDDHAYERGMQDYITECIRQQEQCGLDVLVHGEPERTDMVEYFAEHLDGFAVCRSAWVQSYGSRCVRPPILHSDVQLPAPITVKWAHFAQQLTDKPIKGMLTGPITLLNWSFVRQDRPRWQVAEQIALALRAEIGALEQAGIHIIQVDEPALREGMPLRQSAHSDYLAWAVASFRLATSGVADSTQIHTHMCYARFEDIGDAIDAMDVDVISLETARLDAQQLKQIANLPVRAQMGCGVYDIHAPSVPSVADIERRISLLLVHLDAQRIWVNPDCGLKTRQWPQVRPALANMVTATHAWRRQLQEREFPITAEG
ncbi:5-methyltetrahydropteroyltriglutamate--homocysteine S-methyltransferase [Aestuariibacter halophilus]|uniref:5-methyltetrahydropteroyltriglutamate--homocysteine S-methyltransferase n=1 Tax=Fluctibacter halophilus TaxID=226011 RepID=A0ABS8GA50_9ALTE|nr:5-methyltetrahydropteroyltriglutamate--homocysteine S-methyltransferase [Aestuariibacter halophilus]MCC2616971.1 5-methyltetrahydropteroyltriglutamate--homocysteine S-methyltransferase [Aestuariibacter halophilus]